MEDVTDLYHQHTEDTHQVFTDAASVRQVIEPILSGGAFDDIPEDDRRFVLDLGFVKRSTTGGLEIFNPIYKEILPRLLASNIQDSLHSSDGYWVTLSISHSWHGA